MQAIRSSYALVLATVATLTLGAHPAAATGSHHQQACVRSKALLDRNAQTVVAFYTTAFNFGKPELAVKRYVGVDRNGEKLYIQHNPFAADGPQAFIDFVNFFKSANPELSVRIVRVIAECDLVVTHSHITVNSDDRGSAVMDIFRLDRRGKIVEHWDVAQPIPATSANDNTMF
jgi:predicted SnoaL-like aldol condensation-catalyzing enzyme